VLLDRRRLLGLFGGLGVAGALAACGQSTSGSTVPPSTSSASSSASAAASSASGPVDEVPDETAGPYPGDGSNGPNSLDDSGIVRRDIRSSYDISTNVAEGVPLTRSPRATRRPVTRWSAQLSTSGTVTATAGTALHAARGELPARRPGDRRVRHGSSPRFPGCYDGRWPHIHFEVHSLADATSSGPIVKTSQIALPKEACDALRDRRIRVERPPTSRAKIATMSGTRGVRDDGGIHQIATMSGDASNGYTAALAIGV
jgi:protocatechuate 3,4-dioxygenase beta subunit